MVHICKNEKFIDKFIDESGLYNYYLEWLKTKRKMASSKQVKTLSLGKTQVVKVRRKATWCFRAFSKECLKNGVTR